MFGNRYEKVGPNWFFVLLYLVFAIYLINYPFNFIPIPEVIYDFNDWIIFAGGILILFGAINYFRASRRAY